MKYLICGIPCIEVCMESDHKKSFFYAGRYFVKEADYYGNDCQMAAIPPQDHDLIWNPRTQESPHALAWGLSLFGYPSLIKFNQKAMPFT